VARTCQLYPNAAASTLVHKFFLIFSQWGWPKPVLLRNSSEDYGSLGFPVWDPRINPSDRYHLMPIITPSYPQQNSTFNVTISTRSVMLNEFKIAQATCDKIANGQAEWKDIFEPTHFFHNYKHFITLISTSQAEWIGLVESKIRHLVQSLEKHRCIKLAHINPSAHTRNVPIQIEVEQKPEPVEEKEMSGDLSLLDSTEDKSNSEAPNSTPTTTITEMETIWFIGLEFDKTETVNIDLTQDIQSFIDTVRNTANQSNKYKDEMRIEAKHVRRKELTKYLPEDVIKKGVKRKLSD